MRDQGISERQKVPSRSGRCLGRRLMANLKNVFPEENSGSRLLLTSRKEEVARYVDRETPPHKLRFLDENESWQLFCQKSNLLPSDTKLMEVGKKITKKCGGLPLAIVVLGGLLSRKSKEIAPWKRVSDSISSKLKDPREGCNDILAISYADLPFNMKRCFLYVGLFPEGAKIPAKRLIHFWVAENFFQEKQNEKLEDAAEDCLEDLIDRSLVQVTKRKHDGGVELCHVHDLLRDFAVEEAKKNKFLHTLVSDNSSVSVNVRRLSIQSAELQERHVSNLYTKGLRSLFLTSSIYMGKMEELIPKIQLLRILDMKNLPLEVLPEEINQLIHLRYLGFKKKVSLSTDQNLVKGFSSIFSDCFKFLNFPVNFWERTLDLSPSLSNLINLQTLDLRGRSMRMSHSIWTLSQLRHLYGYNLFIVGDAGDHRIDRLTNLQTLYLQAGDWINNGLENLSNLRELGIYGHLSEYNEVISQALKKSENLRVLKLQTNNIPKLISLSHLEYLPKMVLSGTMEDLPTMHEFPPNLVELGLFNSKLKSEKDLFFTLRNLKELKSLRLGRQIYEETRTDFVLGDLSKLEVLALVNISEVENLNVEEGALNRLKHLYMSLPNLKHIPDGLESMTSLRQLTVRSSKHLIDRVKIGGQDWYKVKHVPFVTLLH